MKTYLANYSVLLTALAVVRISFVRGEGNYSLLVCCIFLFTMSAALTLRRAFTAICTVPPDRVLGFDNPTGPKGTPGEPLFHPPSSAPAPVPTPPGTPTEDTPTDELPTHTAETPTTEDECLMDMAGGGGEKCFDLMTGDSNVVGEVCVSVDSEVEDKLIIRYDT